MQLLQRRWRQALDECKAPRVIRRKDSFLSQWVPQWVRGAVVQCCWESRPRHGRVASQTKQHSESPAPRNHPWYEPPADQSGRPARCSAVGCQRYQRKTPWEAVWVSENVNVCISLFLWLFCVSFSERSQRPVVVACSADDAEMS